MKIAPINSYIRKNYIEFACVLGSLGVIGGWTLPTLHKASAIQIEEQKKEIFEKDSIRYKKAIAHEPSNGFLEIRRFSYWNEEIKNMNDSLRIDSIIKKAYFEGAQMVRDSIAGAKYEHK